MRLRPAQIFLMAVACGLCVANLYYLQPLLAEVAKSLGVGAGEAGLLVTLTQLGYALGLVALVPLGDLFDRRRLVLGLIGIIAVLEALTALSGNWALLGLSLVGLGCVSVAAQVLLPLAATLAAPEQRGRVVGQVMSGLLLGILLARTVSGLVAQLWGWSVIYWAASGGTVLLLLTLIRWLPADLGKPPLRYRDLVSSLPALLRIPLLAYRAAYGALAFAAFSLLWTSLAFLMSGPPYFAKPATIGLFGLVGAAGAGVAALSGRFADLGLARRSTLVFAFLILASFGALALGKDSLLWLIAGTVLLDMGVQGLQITNQSEIYRLAPELRSRITTVYMVCYFLGGTLGSALSADLEARLGWLAVCTAGAACGLLALLLWLVVETRSSPLHLEATDS